MKEKKPSGEASLSPALIERLKSPKVDEEAWRHFVLSTQSTIFSGAMKGSPTSEHAQDATQEALLKLFCKRDQLPPLVGIFGYVQRTGRNAAIDSVRRRSIRPEFLVDFTTSATTELKVDNSDPEKIIVTKLTLQEAMGKLSANHQAVIELVHLQDMSTKDAAKALGIPEGTVKTRTYHALKALRKHLGSS